MEGRNVGTNGKVPFKAKLALRTLTIELADGETSYVKRLNVILFIN